MKLTQCGYSPKDEVQQSDFESFVDENHSSGRDLKVHTPRNVTKWSNNLFIFVTEIVS